MKEPERSSTPNGTTAIGINHNVAVRGAVFHIQTEDLGPALAQVVTHVFAEGGQVVKVARLDYSRHLDSPNLSSALPKVVRAHHQAVTRKLLAGALDSLPELLVLRPSTEAEKAQMNMGSSAGSDLPAKPSSDSLTPTGVKKRAHVEAKRGPSARPKRSPASVWDLLVTDAHRMRQVTSRTEERDGEEPPPSSHAWDQAVEKARNVGHKVGRPAPDSLSNMAEAIFTRGERLLESRDTLGALSCFAHCVHLEPQSKRYRAALRRVLDRVDE